MSKTIKVFFEAKFRAFGFDLRVKREAFAITVSTDGNKVVSIPFNPLSDPDFNTRGVKVWFELL